MGEQPSSSSPQEEPILLVPVDLTSAESILLQGLENWQQLGILSERDLRLLCATRLICQLPVTQADLPPTYQLPAPSLTQVPVRRPSLAASYFLWCFGLIGICGLHRLNAGRTWTGLLWLLTLGLLGVGQFIDLFLIPGFSRPAVSGVLPADAVAPPPDLEEPSPPPPSPEISWQQRVQSLVSEFGVSLLLILGFGLVILASGVLALTQWQNFSPAGQYLVLCSYTLLFWGVSLRSFQPQLLQTQKALRLATLLLIPVNFWAMDGLQLWQSAWGLGTAVGAALILSFAYIRLLVHLEIRGWIWIPSLGLLYLNWGWTELETALWALYLGLIGTTVITVMRERAPASATETTPAMGGFSEVQILLYSSLILLLRAGFSEQILWSELGLAAGLGGWLLLQLPRPALPPQVSYGLGWGCLLLGWILSVSLTPWQALLVSGLALHIFAQRLQRQQLLADLIAVFLVGLQGIWLLSRTIPLSWRETGLEWLQTWAGADLTFWAVWGVVGIPSIWITLGLGQWCSSPRLRLAADRLALGLGGSLFLLSLPYPWMRLMNLLLSASTLAYCCRFRSPNQLLITLIHVSLLGAGFTAIELAQLDLSLLSWAVLLLMVNVGHWLLAVGDDHRLWRRSLWWVGLGFAGISYVVLLGYLGEDLAAPWAWIWVVVPAMLTTLGSDQRFEHRSPALTLSTVAIVALQVLTVPSEFPRLLGLGSATVLLFFNTRQERTTALAVATIGAGLLLITTACLQYLGLDRDILLIALALELLLIYLLQAGAERIGGYLGPLYRIPLQIWGVFLGVSVLFSLSLVLLIEMAGNGGEPDSILVATGLTFVALGFRNWRDPRNRTLLGLAWATELLLVASFYYLDWPDLLLPVAWGNLVLGVGSTALSLWWRKPGRLNKLLTWTLIPLLFTGLGWILFHQQLQAESALASLILAGVGISLARPRPNGEPLILAGICVVSLAAYEGVIYLLMQAESGVTGDGITLLAVVSGVMMLVFRRFPRSLITYLRQTQERLTVLSHVHMAMGTSLLLVAIPLDRSTPGEWLWLLISAGFTSYAWGQGRDSRQLEAEIWVYLGLLIAVAMGWNLTVLLLPDPGLRLGWLGGIASALAWILGILPWDQWGWPARPWRNVAVGLPLVTVVLTAADVYGSSLLLAAGFYAWVGQSWGMIRVSYLSALLLGWAGWRQMQAWEVNEVFWYALPLTLAVLYVAQVDPQLKASSAREQRHWLRLAATGLLCLTAFIEINSSFLSGLGVAGLGMLLTLLGGMLRVRAYLYVGLVTFALALLRQIWLFASIYPLLLWGIGLVSGLGLIWLAIGLESQRERLLQWLQAQQADQGEWQ